MKSWQLPIRFSVALSSLATAVTWDGPASAQIHWDVGAQGGIINRFVTGSEAGAPGPKLGPFVQLTGHLALIPLLRVGLYAATDVTPVSHLPARHFYELGVHGKFAPPLLGGAWRTWVSLGVGYAYTYAPSYTTQETVGTPPGPTTTETVNVGTADGGMLDLQPGIGIGYRVGSVMPFVELGGRFGLAFWGTMYDPNQCTGSTPAMPGLPVCEPYFGQDSFAVWLSVGLSLEE